MHVFISWSGSRSRAVAKLLRDFVPQIVQSAQVGTSTDDIQSGSRWYSEIAQSIQSARLGIVCVTKENLSSPWLAFEAGALSSARIPLIPYLFGLSPVDLSGPLAAFQACKADREGTLRLLQELNQGDDKRVADAVLSRAFDLFWPELEVKLQALLVQESVEEVIVPAKPTTTPPRTTHEMLEELLELSRKIAHSTARGDA